MMKTRHTISFLLITAILWFLSPLACGGSALPQISLPAPSNDCSGGDGCITVSSPDSAGRVTVTGSASAVPNSSVVNFRVSTTISRLIESIDSLIPSAKAAVCTSELPLCASDGSSTNCHITANDDGSFVVQLTASEGESVSVTYLDTTSCEESDALTSEVLATGLLTLGLDGVVMAVNNDDMAYVFGSDTNGLAFATIAINSDGTFGDVTIFSVSTLAGSAVAIDYLSNDEILLVTDLGAAVVDISSGTADLTLVSEITTASSYVGGFVERNHVFPSSNTGANDTCITDALVGETSDRLFLIDASSSSGNLEVAIINDPTRTDSSNRIVAYSVPYIFSNLSSSSDVSLSSLATATVNGADLVIPSHNRNDAYIISRFDIDGSENFYLVQLPVENSLCTQIDASNHHVRAMSPGVSGLRNASFVGFEEAQSHDLMLVPETGTPSLILYDTAFNSHLDIQQDAITLLDPTQLSDIVKTIHIGDDRFAVISSDRNFLGLIDMTPTFDGDGLLESAGVIEPESSQNIGIAPTDMALIGDLTTTASFDDPSTLKLLVLSLGNEADSSSSLRLVEVEDIR